eukprot:UN00674
MYLTVEVIRIKVIRRLARKMFTGKIPLKTNKSSIFMLVYENRKFYCYRET